MSLGLPPATNSLFKTKHVEFFCGKVPVKILYDKHSGIHFVSIEAASTNLTNVSVNYGKENLIDNKKSVNFSYISIS